MPNISTGGSRLAKAHKDMPVRMTMADYSLAKIKDKLKDAGLQEKKDACRGALRRIVREGGATLMALVRPGHRGYYSGKRPETTRLDKSIMEAIEGRKNNGRIFCAKMGKD